MHQYLDTVYPMWNRNGFQTYSENIIFIHSSLLFVVPFSFFCPYVIEFASKIEEKSSRSQVCSMMNMWIIFVLAQKVLLMSQLDRRHFIFCKHTTNYSFKTRNNIFLSSLKIKFPNTDLGSPFETLMVLKWAAQVCIYYFSILFCKNRQ